MKKMKRKTWIIMSALLAALVLAGAAYFYQSVSNGKEPYISGSGIIEGEPLVVRTKLSGQIVELNAEEGNRVTKGQVMAKLDSRVIEDKFMQAKAQLEAAKAQVTSAQAAADALEISLAQSKLVVSLTQEEVSGKISQAKAGLGIAKSFLTQAQAGYDLAKHNYEVAEKSYSAGIIAKNDFTAASLALKEAQGKLEEAQNGVDNAQAVLEQAQSAKINNEVSQKTSDSTSKQVEQTKAGLKAAIAQQQLSEAILAEAKDILDDTIISAPIDGIVTLKAVSNCEMISQGMPVVEITNLEDLNITVYISETEIGKVKLGQAAKISVDSEPEKSFTGNVVNISNKAEFTPNNVHMKDDRTKLVYAVKIHIDNPQGIIKPGMPGDVILQ